MTEIPDDNSHPSISTTDHGEDNTPQAIVSANVNVGREEGVLTLATSTHNWEASSCTSTGRNMELNYQHLKWISSSEQHNIENQDPKDAKIIQLERHLDIMLDENHLLHLELQDLQKSSTTKISSLKYDVSHIEGRYLDMESRIRGISFAINRLKKSLDPGSINATAKTALAEIEALTLLPNVSNSKADGAVNNVNNNNNIYIENVKYQNSNHLYNQSADETENENLKIDEAQVTEFMEEGTPETKVLAAPSKLNVEESNAQSVEKVPLRRSQRKSSKSTGKVKVDSKPLPVLSSEVQSISENQKTISPPKATHSPPVLKPEVNNESITHAVDASRSDDSVFYCVCGRHYLSKQKLKLHILQLTSDWKFQCETCGLKFFEAFKLKKHMWRKHGDLSAEFHGCYNCGEKFENRRDLYVHQRNVHSEGPFAKNKLKAKDDVPTKQRRVYKKRKTGVFAKQELSRKRHYANKVETKKVLKRNQSKTTAAKHCIPEISACKTTNEDSTGATSDIKSTAHRVDTSKDGYFCVCGTSFTSKGGLHVHIKYRTFEAKFACSHCDRKFFSTCQLRAHMKSKHNVLFTGKDGCRRCGRCFPTRQQLYQHCKIVHKCGPLMVKTKKGKQSPEPEPPVLEPEEVQEPLQDCENVIAAAEYPAITSPGKGTCRKQCTDGVSTMSKPARRRRSRSVVGSTKEVSDSNENNLNSETKEGAPLKNCEETTESDDSKLELVDMKSNIEINDSMGAPSTEPEGTATCTRKRKTSTKYMNDQFQITPVVSHHKSSSETPKRRGPGRPPKIPKLTSEQTTSNNESTENGIPVHGVTKATLDGNEVKCTCGMVFTTKSALFSHVRLKTTSKALKCAVCSEGFPRSDYLRRHMQIEHGKVGTLTRKYKTTHGIAAAKTKKTRALAIVAGRNGNVKRKRRGKKSGVHGVAYSKKEFKCLCGMQFVREVTLHEHLRLKIGKRVFKCDFCEESFSRYDYFKDHLRRAHQQTSEGMACRDCGARGFPSHKELRQHRTEFHSNDKKSDNEQA